MLLEADACRGLTNRTHSPYMYNLIAGSDLQDPSLVKAMQQRSKAEGLE